MASKASDAATWTSLNRATSIGGFVVEHKDQLGPRRIVTILSRHSTGGAVGI
jgi:hypothetical protein